MNEIAVTPENSRHLRSALMRAYDLEDKSDVKEFIEEIVTCVAEALADFANFEISSERLTAAFEELVFGKKQSSKNSFARTTTQNGRSTNERTAQKLLRLILCQDIPDEDNFVEAINNSVAKKRGEENFEIYAFLEKRMTLPSETVEEKSLAGSSEDRLPDSLQVGSQIAITYRALSVIAEERGLTPGDEISLQSEVRQQIADLTDLSSHQVTQAASALAKKGFLARKSQGVTYRLFWRPDLADSTEESGKAAEQSKRNQSGISESACFDRQSRLSTGEKLRRIVHAFRQVHRREDYCQSRTVQGTTFVFVGSKHLMMDDFERLGGFSECQRKSAIRKAVERGLVDRDAKFSSKTRYYLRADLAAGELSSGDELLEENKQHTADAKVDKEQQTSKDEEDAVEQEQSTAELTASAGSSKSLAEQVEELNRVELPSLNDPDGWKQLLERADEIEARIRERLTELEQVLEELQDCADFFKNGLQRAE